MQFPARLYWIVIPGRWPQAGARAARPSCLSLLPSFETNMTSAWPAPFPQSSFFLLLQFESPQAQDKSLLSLSLLREQATASNTFATSSSLSA